MYRQISPDFKLKFYKSFLFSIFLDKYTGIWYDIHG